MIRQSITSEVLKVVASMRRNTRFGSYIRSASSSASNASSATGVGGVSVGASGMTASGGASVGGAQARYAASPLLRSFGVLRDILADDFGMSIDGQHAWIAIVA
jgi:hypothetical protein